MLVGQHLSRSLHDVALVEGGRLEVSLARKARSSVPSFLRLEFPGKDAIVFKGTRMRTGQNGPGPIILLVADNSRALIGKFIDLKAAEKNVHRQRCLSQRRQKQLQAEARRLKRLGETDPLTELFNVRAFEMRVRRAILSQIGGPGVLIFLDLNNFKSVNDTFGHAVGDMVLHHTADALRFPPGSGFVAGRIGGDEFALWCSGCSHEYPEDITFLLQERIAEPVIWNSANGTGPMVRIAVTASVGSAKAPEEAGTYEGLKRVADQRMYAEKAKLKAA